MLLAVHIADGVLSAPCLAAGLGVAVGLVALGCWRLRDEDIPRVALLTAAFFAVSLVHLPVGPTSVHLLMTGLMGVVLGRHAALAIPVAVVLQAFLTQHGGVSAVGVNAGVMTLPALAAGKLYALLRRVLWAKRTWFASALVAGSTVTWVLGLVFSVDLVVANRSAPLSALDAEVALRAALHPASLVGALAAALVAAYVERRAEAAPEFALGMVVGEFSVLATVAMNACVLRWGGQEDWPTLVLLVLVPHVAVALVEGVFLGLTLSYLTRVKPELIHWTEPGEPISAANHS